MQHYLDLRDQQRSLKVQIKAKYQSAGVLRTEGMQIYTEVPPKVRAIQSVLQVFISAEVAYS